MFNVDGDLYYDSGLVSKNSSRCGTMDGALKKAVKENEIPLKSGEANFEADGYQLATSITKEVNIDGKWVIFKKYDSYGNLVKEIVYAPNSTDVEYIVKHEYMGTETDFTVTVKDGSIDGYIVYTYKEAKLVAEETYDNDELIQKIQYEY